MGEWSDMFEDMMNDSSFMSWINGEDPYAMEDLSNELLDTYRAFCAGRRIGQLKKDK